MSTRGNWLRGILLGALGLVLCLGSPAHSQRPPGKEETFTQRLARRAKTSEQDADRVFGALGTVVREDLERGKQVTIPGLGTFRVVRIARHRDLLIGAYGRPIRVPATNAVEFIPTGDLTDAANSSDAQPAETVPAFQFIPLPDQTPGQKVGRTRVPPLRTR